MAIGKNLLAMLALATSNVALFAGAAWALNLMLPLWATVIVLIAALLSLTWFAHRVLEII